MARASKIEKDKAELLGYMSKLAGLNRPMYRELLGEMRAVFLLSNPKPGRTRHARALHARVASKVRKIDFRRAEAHRARYGMINRPVVAGVLAQLDELAGSSS